MRLTTHTASDSDLPFLGEVDGHVSHQVLADLVSLGRVMVAAVDGTTVGCLRWGMFWDEVPFMNFLWVVAERRRQGVGTTLVEAWKGLRSPLATTWCSLRPSRPSQRNICRRLGYVDSGALLLPDEPADLILRKPLGE